MVAALGNLAGVVLFGVCIGRHFGVFDGFAAALALYALMPWKPKS